MWKTVVLLAGALALVGPAQGEVFVDVGITVNSEATSASLYVPNIEIVTIQDVEGVEATVVDSNGYTYNLEIKQGNETERDHWTQDDVKEVKAGMECRVYTVNWDEPRRSTIDPDNCYYPIIYKIING